MNQPPPLENNEWSDTPPTGAGTYLAWSKKRGLRLIYVLNANGRLACMHDIEQFTQEMMTALPSDGEDPARYALTHGIQKWSARINFPRE